jgi:hypothetical protein
VDQPINIALKNIPVQKPQFFSRQPIACTQHPYSCVIVKAKNNISGSSATAEDRASIFRVE